MKILQTKDIAPIYLAPGDEIQLTYREPYFGFLGKSEITERELTHACVDKPMTVDRVAVVRYENGELDALGMSEGYGGVFGTRA